MYHSGHPGCVEGKTSLKVKSLALEAGFDPVGITKLAFLSEGERAIHDWVREGRHGTMKYLEDFEARKKRFYADFPEAKSVVVQGVNYYSRGIASSPAANLWRAPRNDSENPFVIASPGGAKQSRISGRIARYAWGRDYPIVIREKHEALIGRLQNELGRRGSTTYAGGMGRGRPSLRFKSCMDIQPLPERFAARQAGLGFIGKNTVLLSKKFGPWLFLSEIVTNLDLPEDLPASGDCGTCAKCQDICPTGALDEDYKIDARRCIAYLTIEYKGVIPRELRPKIKDWIFGCDECLTACPFSSKSKETTWPELHPEAGIGERLDLDRLFRVGSNSQYEAAFRGTVLLRAGPKQMMRNACLVLGNSGRAESVPYLERALADAAALVRLHAAWALGEIGGPEALRILGNPLAGGEKG